VDYELTERARDLFPVVGALARWGYRWAWSPPGPTEAVDVGAILRCFPGFAAPPAVRGTAELIVLRSDGRVAAYVLRVTDGAISYEERTAPEADARISGPERAWVEALGPDASHTELEITGDHALAEAVLAGLATPSAREAAVA
jgi:hypothetical protein